ncbi:3-hydroxybutyrate dehydrogenase [Sandaracinobacteroides saxicola]|uniref:3-hydroxybutyrate dehydrogenase n=1 Tax=Sandaracinobacteroides saxicola TaxID=2759707 RepID=A0A7G5IEJ6_9SPHN|nr:3-hydroxybutyrate dehydrogenase [Sandaracinobacteroides saxicola]QMW21788.1 3-hydroxybutyrate dehydrogenase [Sandaracinobacteroides saxicola]
MTAPSADKPLAGRVAAVTGSTSGIGLAIANALAEAGADVALNGFGDPAPALAAVGAAGGGATRVAFHAADLSKGPDADAWVKAVEADFGRLDILVNNAGIQHVAPIEEFPPEKWDAILAINLSSNFHTIRAAVPGMKARAWGRIIAISSAHGLVASPYKSAYVAAKHGVNGLTKTVALELAETPITCNAICPGFVLTPLVEGQIADQAKANNMPQDQVIRDIILASQPSKRFVTPESIGAMAVFLSTDAGANITGTMLSVDGGWTAR